MKLRYFADLCRSSMDNCRVVERLLLNWIIWALLNPRRRYLVGRLKSKKENLDSLKKLLSSGLQISRISMDDSNFN